MSGLQLELFDDVGLRVEPTPAMRRGVSYLAQCSYCGTLVCPPSSAQKKLGPCPSCRRDAGWWRQDYAGPFRFEQAAPAPAPRARRVDTVHITNGAL